MLTDCTKTDMFQIAQNVETRQKYNKMLIIGVPIGAIRHAKLLDSRRSHHDMYKYRQMLKFGLPIDALCHAMKRDGHSIETTKNMNWWHTEAMN
jgi:hypothetical protein